jgi:hypothetical protein
MDPTRLIYFYRIHAHQHIDPPGLLWRLAFGFLWLFIYFVVSLWASRHLARLSCARFSLYAFDSINLVYSPSRQLIFGHPLTHDLTIRQDSSSLHTSDRPSWPILLSFPRVYFFSRLIHCVIIASHALHAFA